MYLRTIFCVRSIVRSVFGSDTARPIGMIVGSDPMAFASRPIGFSHGWTFACRGKEVSDMNGVGLTTLGIPQRRGTLYNSA
jgi:hypothetical protein